MIQDSQPLARRGRNTFVLAILVFLVAGLIAVLGNFARSGPTPIGDESLVMEGPSLAIFSDDSLSARGTQIPSRPEKRSSAGNIYVILILTAGILFALWLKKSRRPAEANRTLQTVARLSLPHNQEIRIVRVRSTELVVGISQSAMTVLHRFEDSDGVTGTNDLESSPDHDLNKDPNTHAVSVQDRSSAFNQILETSIRGRRPSPVTKKVTIDV